MCQCPQRASTYFFTGILISWVIFRLCQCPQRASTYFFIASETHRKYIDICVNALNGLLLISSEVQQYTPTAAKVVSMPSTGFYLFLPKSRHGDHYDDQIVSMPSTGFYLFLRRIGSWYPHIHDLCQCPQRASTYFFRVTRKTHYTNNRCQCPQRASTYFFKIILGIVVVVGLVCQCPQRASTYFFQRKHGADNRRKICVNALNGLLLISSINRGSLW